MAERDSPATVWASTWVPSKSPFAGFGEAGYAVAWVDRPDRPRAQVLVDGPAAPHVGATGTLRPRVLDEQEVVVFVADGRQGEISR